MFVDIANSFDAKKKSLSTFLSLITSIVVNARFREMVVKTISLSIEKVADAKGNCLVFT